MHNLEEYIHNAPCWNHLHLYESLNKFMLAFCAQCPAEWGWRKTKEHNENGQGSLTIYLQQFPKYNNVRYYLYVPNSQWKLPHKQIGPTHIHIYKTMETKFITIHNFTSFIMYFFTFFIWFWPGVKCNLSFIFCVSKMNSSHAVTLYTDSS